jgi:voltage-gated potassium channel
VRDRYTAFIDRHEIAWELGMGLLAILYVAVGFALDAAEPGVVSSILLIETILTIVFVLEFATRLGASRDRIGYLRGHWIDVVALLPVARGFRLARLLRVLRLTRFFAGAYRAVIRAEHMRGSEGIARVIVAWSAVTVISCIALYAVESGANPEIEDPFDALWWGVSTLSTVGYGDVIPVTPEGRLVAGALMLLGIGLFGAITAIATNSLVYSEARLAEARLAEGRLAEGRPAGGPVDELERLAALRASDALSAEEFTAAKERLIARM